jgi:hypothetical protein
MSGSYNHGNEPSGAIKAGKGLCLSNLCKDFAEDIANKKFDPWKEVEGVVWREGEEKSSILNDRIGKKYNPHACFSIWRNPRRLNLLRYSGQYYILHIFDAMNEVGYEGVSLLSCKARHASHYYVIRYQQGEGSHAMQLAG